MPMVDVIDETFVVARPADVAAAVKDPGFLARVFPRLGLIVFEDRGDEGVRLTVTGELVGTNEFWVEPWGDGAIVHYYLRADPTRKGSATEPRTGPPRRLWRQAVRMRTAHCARLKAGLNEVKDRLEAGRAPGMPPEWAVPPAPAASAATAAKSPARRRAGSAGSGSAQSA
ncbi:MAG TPA: polyketide cyclase / dehydrase and lipid transport [Frankiaceae bacterium]|nr:polyketide cyclase / dehydrase and lipid transport [Frankiaceae bacterium]